MATFYNGLAMEKLLSRRHMERIRVSQGGYDPDLVLGPRVADHGWGLGYMLNQRCVAGPNPQIFGHGGLGGSFAFVDLEHRIGYAYVMNHYDATKANADPAASPQRPGLCRAGVTGQLTRRRAEAQPPPPPPPSLPRPLRSSSGTLDRYRDLGACSMLGAGPGLAQFTPGVHGSCGNGPTCAWALVAVPTPSPRPAATVAAATEKRSDVFMR